MVLLREFRDFAMRGNVVDMAIGVVMGAAFGKIVSSFTNDVLMPPVGLLVGGVDFSYLAIPLKAATAESPGVALQVGAFVNTMIDFAIIAFAIFLVVKAMNAVKKKQEAAPAPPSRQEVLLTEIRDALRAR